MPLAVEGGRVGGREGGRVGGSEGGTPIATNCGFSTCRSS